MTQRRKTGWFASGDPWIWLTASAVAAAIVMVVGLLTLIAYRGMGHFWPHTVVQFEYSIDGAKSVLAGEVRDSDLIPAARARDAGLPVAEDAEPVTRLLIKAGNRDVTREDFVWIAEPFIANQSIPENMVVFERREWGNLYGFIDLQSGQSHEQAWQAVEQAIERSNELHERIEALQKGEIGGINYQLERLRLRQRALELDGEDTPKALAELEQERQALNAAYNEAEQRLTAMYEQFGDESVAVTTAPGVKLDQSVRHIVRAYRPNAMSLPQKLGHYVAKFWEFISDDPREANTEGGVFPAIFGTVLMVLLMSVLVAPLGVIAALYLREYAKQGILTRTISIAVNNLAGVPSIVYGVFGLGFFVYTLGGSIDALFYPEALPSPTFGTGGLMWASVTLALLTLPVVIVSTEEGLTRIPRAIREGSLALGATQAETLWRTVIPMASPAIMTGVILAVARAAGEVAPLMLVGVVKLAPSLPLDLNYPFFHPDRKFMHLGFHIYDVGFQSPNVEAARPLVYATALLLVAVIVLLNLVAIRVRNRLREKYRALEN